MKGFQKLALAAAIAAAPFAAQAELTAMDDSLLSEMTGQAGVTLDLNLDVIIDEIRYADEDGATVGGLSNDGGYLTLSNLVIDGDNASGQAEIKGVTIDVDGTDGIVIGLGEIGSATALSKDSGLNYDIGGGVGTATGSQAAVATGAYWTGVNVSADFGINGVEAGSVAIKGITNFVPNALAVEAVSKFGYTLGTDIQLTNDTGTQGADLTAAQINIATNAGAGATQAQIDAATGAEVATNSAFTDALVSGAYVEGNIRISAGGGVDSDSTGATQGLTINASTGFVINDLSYTDDGRSMGLHNFVMFDTDASGNIIGFQVSNLTIDVVDHVGTNSSATEALRIAGMNTSGTIAIGDIYVGDAATGSLGALSIKGINMSNTEIFVYGH